MKPKVKVNGATHSCNTELLPSSNGSNLYGVTNIKWKKDNKGLAITVIECVGAEIDVINIPDSFGRWWNITCDGQKPPIIVDFAGKDVSVDYNEIEFEVDALTGPLVKLTPVANNIAFGMNTMNATSTGSSDYPHKNKKDEDICQHDKGKYLSFNFYRCNTCGEVVN